jgi:hypothetical protein
MVFNLFDDNSWREVVSVSKFRSKELKYKINLKEVAMTFRDQEWLVSLLFVLYKDITALNTYLIRLTLHLGISQQTQREVAHFAWKVLW